jgi:DNA polymerase type B, organellar and viral
MQPKETVSQNKWQKYIITLSEDTKMSSPLLQYAINKFKSEIINNLEENQFYHCQLQCNFHVIDEVQNMNYYIYQTISYLQFFKKDGEKESTMLDIFWHFWIIFYEERYKVFLVKSICFQYKVLPIEYNNFISSEDIKLNINPKPLQERVNKTVEHIEELEPSEQLNYKNHSGHSLPLTMDITKWGYTIFNKTYNSAVCWGFNTQLFYNLDYKKLMPILYDVNNINSFPEYIIKIFDTYIHTSLRIKGNEIFYFEDKLLNTQQSVNLPTSNGESSLNNFIRTIKKTTFLFIDGKEQFMIKDKPVKFIKPKKNKDSFKGTQFITMDLETKAVNGILNPYCVSIFNGKTVSSFYITDFKDSTELLENVVKSLMKKEYNGYKVFLHNFSYFDGIFLLSIITSLSNDVKILIRDSRIIDVKVGFGKSNIFFRDSLLMIPISLAKAAKSFNVEDKGKFPYRFVNQPEINYDYVGPVPSYDFFESINEDDFTEEDYKEYCKDFNNDWDLEKETIKYCEQDCITLYQILQKFSTFIYDEFKINFLNAPTLSSLAFIIYRTNFMKDLKNKLPIIIGKTYSDIKKSYTGGAVDVYLPYGENLFLYDINSLYPAVMRENPMPVGQPTYFEGDILKYNNISLTQDNSNEQKDKNVETNNDRPFGFFEVEIITPNDILNPILQTKLNGRYGRTIAPIGKWIGWYFSEELYNAEKYGYKLKVLRGYTFEKSFIFPDYVDTLYSIKCNSEPGTAMYTVSKLLLNSLYGRLGMSPFVENHTIVESSKSNDLLLNEGNIITNVVDLQNGKELISYFNKI